MSATDIKTRHDMAIRRAVAVGATISDLTAATGKGLGFVRHRLCVLGLSTAVVANLQERRAVRRAARLDARGRVIGHCGSRVVEVLPAAEPDRSASELARGLRANRAALAAYDSSHMVACFHAAGLTLEDIEAGLGIPPVEAVAAIRRAHQGHRL